MEMQEEPESVLMNSSRLKSAVWNDFDRVLKGDSMMAICRHCQRKLCGSSTSGTSHLRNHLNRCPSRPDHEQPPLVPRGKRKNSSITVASLNFGEEQRNGDILSIVNTKYGHVGGNEEGVVIGGVHFDHKRSRLDLARMIIMHGYSLKMVEHCGFKIFVRNLQPLFDLATFERVEADCKEIYEVEKQKVREELSRLLGKVSVCVDTWVANADTKYLSLTAQFIDNNWQLKKKVLDFFPIDSSQTKDSLCGTIMKSLRNWGIDTKLFSMTFDNLSSHDDIVRTIRDQLCDQGVLVCNGQLFDVRCAADVVKLMAQDVLQTSFEIIDKLRESIRYVKTSQAVQDKFNEMVQLAAVKSQKCLVLDNPLLWHSTFVMLESLMEYRNAFVLLQEHDPLYTICPSGLEWDRGGDITDFLKLFVDVSNVFVGNKVCTANLYFTQICDIHLKLIDWCQKPDDFISSLALKMKRTFDEYWKKCSLALAIAAILDPRFKMQLVDCYYPEIYVTTFTECIEIVQSCMKALYQGHEVNSQSVSQGQGAAPQLASSDSRSRLNNFDKYVIETQQTELMRSDLDKYLEEPLFPRIVDFNVLNWWKTHAPRYPTLATMARNILGIPLSKTSLEALFTTGKRVIDQSWTSLQPDTLRVLMCARDWLCSEMEAYKLPSS